MTTASQWPWRSPTYRTTSSPVMSLMRWCWDGADKLSLNDVRRVIKVCLFVCLFLCADVAGWLLQGSAWPHPVQPVLVSWHDHAGQDQSRTTSAGHTPDDMKPNCVCVCVWSQYNYFTAPDWVGVCPNPNCKYQMGLILTIPRRASPQNRRYWVLSTAHALHRQKIKIVREIFGIFDLVSKTMVLRRTETDWRVTFWQCHKYGRTTSQCDRLLWPTSTHQPTVVQGSLLLRRLLKSYSV